MPGFHFRIVDRDGIFSTEQAYQFENADAACRHAKTVLAEMALDGLPGEPVNAYSVQVLDAQRHAIYEVRLKVEIIPSLAKAE